MANRKHHAIDTAAAGRWRLLGRLLRVRRVQLGYRYRPAFAEARLPRTPQGNLMIRALNAIENGERPGTYAPGTMEMYARAYEVTPQSVYAVLEGSADELTPAAAAPAPGLPPAPMEPGREAAIAPVAILIWEALVRLRDRGIRNPPGDRLIAEVRASPGGARLGLGDLDARIWDGSEGAMSEGNRAWLTADMHIQRRSRGSSSEAAG